MGQTGDAATQANIRKELYLDQPKWKQFLYYINDVSPVSFYSVKEIKEKKLKGIFLGKKTKAGIKIPYLRKSYQTKKEVGSVLAEALPGTLILAFAAMLIAVVIGIPLGVIAAVKKGTWLDTSSVFASIVGISAPSFFMGIVIAYIFGFVLSDWTGLHINGNWFDVDEVTGERKWTLQNLIIWKKKTSAVPQNARYGKHYQILAFATKGKSPRVFNKLRIDPPLLETEKYRRPNGMYVTDVWDDIRELTSGYFAGDEPLRGEAGERFHKQQSPVALLVRIILSSTQIGDTVFDPFAGTGTTLVTAHQLDRNSIGIEIDPQNVAMIKNRLEKIRDSDTIQKYYQDYLFTENLANIWGS